MNGAKPSAVDVVRGVIRTSMTGATDAMTPGCLHPSHYNLQDKKGSLSTDAVGIESKKRRKSK